jgi:hypothetical protein
MTFPGVSMMGWMIGCRRDLVAAKVNQGVTNITYLRVGGPKTDDPRQMFKPLLFRSLRFTKRFWVSDVAIVLV